MSTNNSPSQKPLASPTSSSSSNTQLLPPQQNPPPPPHDPSYDSRRLFPFGLSPIPELPSELASEVSTTCPTPSHHSDDEDDDIDDEESSEEDYDEDEDEDTDTEVESIRSVKKELEEEEEEDTEEEEEEDSACQRNYQCKTPLPKVESEDIEEEEEDDDEYEEEEEEEDEEEEGEEGEEQEMLLNPSQSGAETASEIFRHLQATRDKSEMTAELAKILNVLETTLTTSKEELLADDEDEDDDTTALHQEVMTMAAAAKLPPKHPNKSSLKKKESPKRNVVHADARATDVKSKRAGDEMGILSKILVTLLCSCKSAEAAKELKKVIRQFRDAAQEATDQVGDEIASTSSGRSSRSRKGGGRTRKSSGSSEEADSLTNTLTPNYSESKSSEDDDEGRAAKKAAKMRFSIKVEEACQKVVVPSSSSSSNSSVSNGEAGDEHTVKVIVSIPRRNSNPEATEPDMKLEQEANSANTSPRTRRNNQMGRNDSTSSESTRELSSSEGGRSECRKLLSDMECGAYNSDSLNSPGHSGLSDVGTSEQSRDSPREEDEEDEWSPDDASSQDFQSKNKKKHGNKKLSKEASLQGEEAEEHLINHLEETFKVLDGAFRIIEETTKVEEPPKKSASSSSDEGKSFEDILQGVTEEAVKLDNEIRQSSTPRSITSAPTSRPASSTNHQPPPINPNPNRPRSQASRAPSRANRPPSAAAAGSRAPSRRRSRPPSRQVGDQDAEEDWGDEDEWEYYYEEEEEEEDVKEPEPKAQPPIVNVVPTVNPVIKSDSHSSIKILNKPDSRPSSRQKKIAPPLSGTRPNSRPNSRSGSRPTSRQAASRLGLRTPLKGIGEDEEYDDDEWEYYYEDDEEEELNRLSPTTTTAPTTRATSPFPLHQQQQQQQQIQEQQKPKVQVRTLEINNPTVVSPVATWEEVVNNDEDTTTVHTENKVEQTVHEAMADERVSCISQVSVALAAEFLGQTTQTPLPEDESVKKKKKHKKSSKSKDEDRKHKKKKKKSKDKDLDDDDQHSPKTSKRLGVKALVSKLEPKLFKDQASGTKMVMSQQSARTSIEEKKINEGKNKRKSVKEMVEMLMAPKEDSPPKSVIVDPMDAKGVGRVVEDVKRRNSMIENPPPPPPPPPPISQTNPINLPPIFNSPQLNRRTSNTTRVMTQPDGTAQVVQMRNKRGLRTIPRQQENVPKSPDEGSEAYGTGSSTAEVDHYHHQQQLHHNQQQQREGSVEESSASNSKPGSRHSRLFRLLQDSDYSDSDSTSEHSKKDSNASGKLLGRDSAAECDTSSVASSFSLAKGSPVVTRRSTNPTGLRPSASFCLESPNSTGGAIPKYPATRVWSYLREEFDNSSPQSGVGGRRSSSSYDATRSPKLHMELLELATFPSASNSKEQESSYSQQQY